jgi:probable HAF family extracellular repeat protein
MQDFGTLGGPLSEAFWISDSGDIAGSADLPTPGQHDAVVWKHGRIHDLGTVSGDPCSRAYGLNSRGQVVGTSSNCVDALHAFVWEERGPMLDLNTLIPRGSGQVGVAGDTGKPDPLGEDFCGFGDFNTCLPYVWQRGNITVLPLPAGSNGAATGFNNRDEVAGKVEQAGIDPSCQPASHQTQGIIWKGGRIERLLPNYPGDLQGAGHSINDLGQAVGWSGNCGGPQFNNHALLWDHGHRIDLGSLGGTSGQAYNINNRSDVVGFSRVAAGPRHGFLWRRGKMTDLGLLPGDLSSEAAAINDQGEVVGFSTDADGNERAVLWCHGTIAELNTLVSGDSPLYLLEGDSINDRGDIVGIGLDSVSGEIHAYLASRLTISFTSDSHVLWPSSNPLRYAKSLMSSGNRSKAGI